MELLELFLVGLLGSAGTTGTGMATHGAGQTEGVGSVTIGSAIFLLQQLNLN